MSLKIVISKRLQIEVQKGYVSSVDTIREKVLSNKFEDAIDDLLELTQQINIREHDLDKRVQVLKSQYQTVKNESRSTGFSTTQKLTAKANISQELTVILNSVENETESKVIKAIAPELSLRAASMLGETFRRELIRVKSNPSPSRENETREAPVDRLAVRPNNQQPQKIQIKKEARIQIKKEKTIDHTDTKFDITKIKVHKLDRLENAAVNTIQYIYEEQSDHFRQLDNERRRQAKIAFNVSIGFLGIGILVLVVGFTMLLLGAIDEGKIGSIVGVILNFFGVALFMFYKNVNDRLDETKKDLEILKKTENTFQSLSETKNGTQKDIVIQELLTQLRRLA